MNRMDEAFNPSKLSPIMHRASGFFDHHFDSISAFSESTIADSEYVAQQILKYEKEKTCESSTNKQSTIYNLRIDKVVIDGAKSEHEIEKPVKAAVSQIISELHSPSSNKSMIFRSDSECDKIQKSVCNWRVLASVSLLVISVVVLSIALPMLMRNGEIPDEVTTTKASETTEPTTTIFNSESSSEPTIEPTTMASSVPTTLTSSVTTTISTTTPTPRPVITLVKREAWHTENFDLYGRYKQLVPIKKIILTRTMSDSCYDSESCIDFMAQQQNHAYPLLDDVGENFLIDSRGVVYEGRGFHRESQTTVETYTSYNNKAVSVSFIVNESESQPNEKQQEAFCHFVQLSINDGNLDGNYAMFEHSAILSSYGEEIQRMVIQACDLNWREPPKIVKRRDWNGGNFSLNSENSEQRWMSRRVEVFCSENKDEDCSTKEACSQVVKKLQEIGIEKYGEIEFNFIFGGDLIFEGRNFDLALPLSIDSLRILFLGEKPGEALMEKLSDFIKYATEMGKLTENFKLESSDSCKLVVN